MEYAPSKGYTLTKWGNTNAYRAAAWVYCKREAVTKVYHPATKKYYSCKCIGLSIISPEGK